MPQPACGLGHHALRPPAEGLAPTQNQAHSCASTSDQRSDKAQSRGVWRCQVTTCSREEGPQGGSVGVTRREGECEAWG